MTEKSHINILQYQFDISFPYTEGHVLTAHEANIFNHHRADCIRKVARRWVLDAAQSSPNQILSVEELTKLSVRISNLDKNHQFNSREEPPISPLEYQIRLATRQMHPLPRSHPEVQQRARELLLAGQMSFEDLLS